MVAQLTGWELASIVFKYLWYLGLIAAVGGSFSIWLIGDDSRRFLQRNLIYTLLGALVAFHAVLLYLLVQVGIASGGGLAGMLDWPMIRFYLGLAVGEASLLRMAVLLLLIVGQIVALSHIARLMRPPGQRFFHILLRFNAACLFLLVLSFQATGHIATLALPARVALVLHAIGIALWMGSLWPLLEASRDYGQERSAFIMIRFGRLASFFVAGLVIAGGWLLLQVIATPAEMLGTAYGRNLTLKLVVVCALLGLAAMNRWRLVPNLANPGTVKRLRVSIGLEMAAGAAILLLTAVLSTVVGPMAHAGM